MPFLTTTWMRPSLSAVLRTSSVPYAGRISLIAAALPTSATPPPTAMPLSTSRRPTWRLNQPCPRLIVMSMLLSEERCSPYSRSSVSRPTLPPSADTRTRNCPENGQFLCVAAGQSVARVAPEERSHRSYVLLGRRHPQTWQGFVPGSELVSRMYAGRRPRGKANCPVQERAGAGRRAAAPGSGARARGPPGSGPPEPARSSTRLGRMVAEWLGSDVPGVGRGPWAPCCLGLSLGVRRVSGESRRRRCRFARLRQLRLRAS